MKKILVLFIVLLTIISCDDTTKYKDDEAPSILIYEPANGSVFSTDETITIKAEATDNEGILKVEFYVDNDLISTDTEKPYECVWDTKYLHGQHTIYGKAYDIHENSSITNNILVTVEIITGTVTDIDGNVYQTLVIGNQEWMIDNLKVTHYSNGDTILNITSDYEWSVLYSGAYCYFNNDSINAETYGALYNWYAVNSNIGLAPEGWHIPSDEEIKELEMYIGMSQSEIDKTGFGRGTNEGSILAGGHDLWYNGDLRNDPEFNHSAFFLIPSGCRHYTGLLSTDFFDLGRGTYFWSSTGNSSSDAWNRALNHDEITVYRSSNHKRHGYSVRCVKD